MQHWLLLGFSADGCPFKELQGGMNEKPPRCSLLPNSTFWNATQSRILVKPADAAPNISPASSLPPWFFMRVVVSSLFFFFPFALRSGALSPHREGYNSLFRRAVCDLSLLLSLKERIFHWRQGLCTRREISTLEARTATWMRMGNFAVGIHKPLTASSPD